MDSEGIMSEAPGYPIYSTEQRARIRAALLQFMEQTRIGTPTLQSKIIEADTPHHRELPLSTLQRFLGGRRRTQDHYVAMCDKFVKTLAGYDERQASIALGAMLSGFLTAPSPIGKPGHGLSEILAAQFAGTYDGRSTQAHANGKAGSSQLTLTQVPGTHYLEALEQVRDARGRRHIYEGALVLSTQPYFALLRNALTRQPRTLHLDALTPAQSERGGLQGQGFETSFGAESLSAEGPMTFAVTYEASLHLSEDEP